MRLFKPILMRTPYLLYQRQPTQCHLHFVMFACTGIIQAATRNVNSSKMQSIANGFLLKGSLFILFQQNLCVTANLQCQLRR